jgi:hypothetical protein
VNQPRRVAVPLPRAAAERRYTAVPVVL